MTGYMPAEQDIRDARARRTPPAPTAARWHDHPFEGASDVGLPGGAVYGPAPDTTVTPEWWRP
jgi:hypothetical protein